MPPDDVAAIGSLQEPVRRALYEYVVGQPHDVSRDEAAGALGVQRNLAAFHLDKLVEAGLLETAFRRLSGRTGPGAGRPAKLYRRSPSDFTVSLPPRQYDLAAELLAQAVQASETGGRPAGESLLDVARQFGLRLGREIRARLAGRVTRERRLAAAAETLKGHGYEPQPEERGRVHLANCPFHALAEGHRDLVCGMNLSLMEGVVEGMGDSGIEAQRDARPGQCCVSLVPRSARR